MICVFCFILIFYICYSYTFQFIKNFIKIKFKCLTTKIYSAIIRLIKHIEIIGNENAYNLKLRRNQYV